MDSDYTDIIERTPPFDDIEEAFGIAIDDDAATRILEMQRLQSAAGQGDG